jgi:hypothetical protein
MGAAEHMKFEPVVALVLAGCAPAIQAQCTYRDSLAPLESIEGITAEQIEAGRVLREAIDKAFARQDERQEILSREENERIRGVTDGNTEQVFFLRIFDDFMPVPNRFVASSPGTFRTLSRRPEDDLGLSGVIRFGPRSELELPAEEFAALCEKAVFTRHGLNVEVRDFFQGLRWVTIYNDSEFLSIIDANHSLWEAMLDVWHEPDGRRDE